MVPSRAALISSTVPTKVVVASSTPSPVPKVSPAVLPSVSVPLVADSVTMTGLLPASMSPIDSRLPRADENTSGVSSGVTCGPGTSPTGASLTAVTVTSTESESASAPPTPVWP